MDILAHALYGATLFSRAGLAGGRRGAPRSAGPFGWDWTVWAAVGFGVLPDMASIGVVFIKGMLQGMPPSFPAIPPQVFVLYHSTHSLLMAGVLVLLLRLVARPLAIPALAWPLHLLMDSVSHGDGRWQTLLFYPLSDWHFDGLNWWQHPQLILLYWGVLPILWLGLFLWRRFGAGRTGCAPL